MLNLMKSSRKPTDMSNANESSQLNDRDALKYLYKLKPQSGSLAATRQEAAENLMEMSFDVKVASAIVGQKNAIEVLVTLAHDCLKAKDYRMVKPILSIIADLLHHKLTYGMLPEEKSIVGAVMKFIYEGRDQDCAAEAFKAMMAALGRPGEELWWSALQGDSGFAPRVLWILEKKNNLNLLERWVPNG